MGYGMVNGEYADTEDLGVSDTARALKASGAIAATGSGAGRELGDKGILRLLLAITAVAGTNPTLDVTVETSIDNGVADAWRSIGTFAQKTGVSTERKTFVGADRFVRLSWTIGGTASPSFTFSVTGEAV